MQYAEFEEKEYEGFLYPELVNGTPNLWTPGQVLEHHFGVDAVIELLLDPVWGMLGYPVRPKGVIPDDLAWGFIWRRLGDTRRLPTFRANAFIQAKRPQILRKRSSSMKLLGLGTPYWRFLVDQNQQSSLEAVARRLGNRAAVLYASAAFGTLDELFKYFEARQLASNSTFVGAHRLVGHSSWNYDQPGTTGIACTEPERIEDRPLAETIAELSAEAESTDDPNSDLAVRNLEFLINGLLQSLSEIDDPDPRTSLFLRLLREQPVLADASLSQRGLRAFQQVLLFSMTHAVSWYVVG